MNITTVDPPILHGPADPDNRPPADPEAYATETALRSLVSLGAATSPRSQQKAIGASEIGQVCDRRLAYRLAGAVPVNVTDPTRSLVGTGVHEAMARMFARLDGGSGRFLVEADVRYRGIPGRVDLYDRFTGTVIDWKTTLRNKLGRIRMDGPPAEYVTQLQLYGAALTDRGERVRRVALAYLAIDSTLDDLWVWQATYDPKVADAAIDRLNVLAQAEFEAIPGRIEPSTVEATATKLCPWCPWYRADHPVTDQCCPGR